MAQRGGGRIPAFAWTPGAVGDHGQRQLITQNDYYDAFARRYGKTITIGGNTTPANGVFDGWNPVDSHNATSYTATMMGLVLDELYLENFNSSVLKDGLGSVVGLTNLSKGLTDTYSYDPYGTPTHTSGGSLNGALFAGQSCDFNNLYYMRARYYMPSIARFLSRDPAGAGVNPYLYAGDVPSTSATRRVPVAITTALIRKLLIWGASMII